MTSDRWRELAEADAVESPLTEEERAFLAGYDDEDVALERVLFAGIAELGEARQLRDDDRLRARATLERFRAGQPTPRRTGTWMAAGVAGLLAVAAAAALWLYQEPEPTDLAPTTVTEARIAKGSFMLAGRQIADGEALPGGEWVQAKARSCVTTGTGRACFRKGSELRILDGVVELRSGLMEVEEGSVSLMGDEGVTELGHGSQHEIATDPVPGPEEVAVQTPEPVPEEDEEIVEDASETEGASPRKRKKSSTKSAGQMLAEARALANKGKLGAAVSAYAALRRAHPGSAEARAANVSTGQLQLRRGRARDALKAFDRYLKHGGSLAEEARWGRVRALDRLGKKAARDRAIDRLVQAHPHSVYAAKARALKGT